MPQACAGENLLINWVEQDNYRTIAGAAMAYGHSIVSQSPIDVNIAKQMNILLSNMDIKKGQIVIDHYDWFNWFMVLNIHIR